VYDQYLQYIDTVVWAADWAGHPVKTCPLILQYVDTRGWVRGGASGPLKTLQHLLLSRGNWLIQVHLENGQ